MDWQRTLLIAALAVVSYLMILQWQKDYMDQPAAQAVTSPQSYPQDAAIPDNATADTPADVPQAVAGSEPAPAVTPAAVAAPATQLIEVETDVLQLAIDPVGGDIVQLALKQYPVSIDRPETPIQLLRQDGGFTYIAQSGLIG